MPNITVEVWIRRSVLVGSITLTCGAIIALLFAIKADGNTVDKYTGIQLAAVSLLVLGTINVVIGNRKSVPALYLPYVASATLCSIAFLALSAFEFQAANTAREVRADGSSFLGLAITFIAHGVTLLAFNALVIYDYVLMKRTETGRH